LGYFWASFYRLLGRNLYTDLANPLAHLLHCPGLCNPGGPAMVTLGSGRHTPILVAMLQTDFIHCASAISTWTVQNEFEIATLADFLCCC